VTEGLNLLKDGELPRGWMILSLCALRRRHSITFNPEKEPSKTLELYSVPSHATGKPEIIKATEIGSNKQYVDPDDVLVSKINPRLNRAWVVGNFTQNEKIASTEWIVFSKNKLVLPKLLRCILADARVRDYLSHNVSGVGGSLTRVKPSLLDTISIGLPPENEQHRIVTKIEELFSELDKGIESLKTAREQLKVYRQAVFKHAFEGKLTAQWRKENKDKLETAGQLLTRIQEKRETRYQHQLEEWNDAVKTWELKVKPGKKPAKPKNILQSEPLAEDELSVLPAIPSGWSYIRLGSIINEPKYGTSKKCSYEYDGIGVLRIPNIVSGVIDANDLKFAEFDSDEIETYNIRRGDILTIRSNGSISIVGKCALTSEYEEKYLYAGYLIRLRPNDRVVSSAYLLAVLSSHLLRSQIEAKAKSTSGVNNINSGELQSLIVPICTMKEQSLVVAYISAVLSSIDNLEEEIEVNLKKSESLRQSILKKAFSGQLIEQDPKDEPASVLLERIKAEKARQTPRKKTAKRSRLPYEVS